MKQNEAQAQVNFIEEIINKNRETILNQGIFYIFWGILIAMSMIIQYFFLKFHLEKYLGIYWGTSITFGWISTIFIVKKNKQQKSASNYAEKILSSVWISFGISSFIIGFLPTLMYFSGMNFLLHFLFITPLISIFLGMAYFITGEITKFRWLKIISFGWFLGGIALFFIQSTISFLVFAGMIIILQIVPGIVIKVKGLD